MKRRLTSAVGCLVVIALLLISMPGGVLAVSQEALDSIYNDTVWYKPTEATPSTCQPGSGSYQTYPDQVDPSLVSELDGIIQSIKPNIDVYQAAAARWGIPWQAIAATHWREGTAGARKSMVNGRDLPTPAQLNGRQYLWGSASVNIPGLYESPDQVPGPHPARRFYATLLQDTDYATWLLIEHGLRLNPEFGNDGKAFVAAAQSQSITKDQWVRTWGAYLGSLSDGYGNFGRDSGGRMGAGAIMAYLGGLVEKPPAPSVQYPGSADSDYDKVPAVSGIGGPAGCDVGVILEGHIFPLLLERKSDYSTQGGTLSAVPCNNVSCHHDGSAAFDLGRSGYGARGEGAPVLAISDGEVQSINYDYQNPDTGFRTGCNSIQFKSTDGFVYWYGHLAPDRSIRVNQPFKAGQEIGKVGESICTGNYSTPHLHIDRGSPKGSPGGSVSGRDQGIISLINKLFEAVPD